MKKEHTSIIIMAVIVLAAFTAVIWISEAQSSEQARVQRVEEQLKSVASVTGYESLGVIDGYAISKENGMLYDGPAIKAELAKRAGRNLDNSWTFTFGEEQGIMLLRLVVYEGEMTEPVFDQKVEKVYIYGSL